MMIREATYFDLPHLLELSKKFYDFSGLKKFVPQDEDHMLEFGKSLLENPDAIVLVGENSMLMGLVYPHLFNPNIKVFQEFVWWSEDRQGLKMLKLAEKLAKEKGAYLSSMVALEENKDVIKLYGRMDYSPVELTYVKVL